MTATKKKKILIVDDEREIVENIAEIIRSANDTPFEFDITSCYDGVHACDQIHKNQFDLVFLDRIMPGLRGEQVIARIREEPGPNQHTPIVMISGMMTTMEEDLQAERFEKVYFIDKPFNAEKILRILKLYLHAL